MKSIELMQLSIEWIAKASSLEGQNPLKRIFFYIRLAITAIIEIAYELQAHDQCRFRR